ncbi:hypothetical protein M2267_005942 [Ensifer sp. KUDG1]
MLEFLPVYSLRAPAQIRSMLVWAEADKWSGEAVRTVELHGLGANFQSSPNRH